MVPDEHIINATVLVPSPIAGGLNGDFIINIYSHTVDQKFVAKSYENIFSFSCGRNRCSTEMVPVVVPRNV